VIEEVREFLNHCCEEVSRSEHMAFNAQLRQELDAMRAVSDVEKRFYIAFCTLAKMNKFQKLGEITHGGVHYTVGCGLISRARVDGFEVDFRAVFGREPWSSSVESGALPQYREIIVDCGARNEDDVPLDDEALAKIAYREEKLSDAGHKILKLRRRDIRENPNRAAAQVLAALSYRSEQKILHSTL